MTTALKTRAANSGEFQLVERKSIIVTDNVRFTLTDIDDLAASIAEVGLLTPLILNSSRELSAGHRRLAAIDKLIASKQWVGPIPVFVRTSDDDDTSRLVTQLIENLQRVDLNPIEEALGIHALAVEHKMKPKDIAARLRRTEAHVKDRLRLATLPEKRQQQVIDRTMSIALAVEFSKLDATSQESLAKLATISQYHIDSAKQSEARRKAAAKLTNRLMKAGFLIVDKFSDGLPVRFGVTDTDVDKLLVEVPADAEQLEAVISTPTYGLAVRASLAFRSESWTPENLPATATPDGEDADVSAMLAELPAEVVAWAKECYELLADTEREVDAWSAANAEARNLHIAGITAKQVALALFTEKYQQVKDWGIPDQLFRNPQTFATLYGFVGVEPPSFASKAELTAWIDEKVSRQVIAIAYFMFSRPTSTLAKQCPFTPVPSPEAKTLPPAPEGAKRFDDDDDEQLLDAQGFVPTHMDDVELVLEATHPSHPIFDLGRPGARPFPTVGDTVPNNKEKP